MAANEQIGATLTRDRGYVQWAPVIAGAIAAAALAVVLNTFGAGIGLAVKFDCANLARFLTSPLVSFRYLSDPCCCGRLQSRRVCGRADA